MSTKETLERLPEINKKYLKTLKDNIRKAEENRQHDFVKEYNAVARGYIRGLVDCGVIDDFKPVWCWFTL